MEATNGFKQRLEKAKDNSEFIKIIFQYPESTRAKIKKGKVIKVYPNSFDLDEIYDGHVAYSFDYIVEIVPVKKEGESGITKRY